MKWKNALTDYKHYLKLERGLSENSIVNYELDVLKLVRFLETTQSTTTPLLIDADTVKDFIYQIAKVVNERSQTRIISGLKSFFKM